MKNLNVFKITSILIGVIGFILVIPIPIFLVMGTLGFGDSITDSQKAYAMTSFWFAMITALPLYILLSE